MPRVVPARWNLLRLSSSAVAECITELIPDCPFLHAGSGCLLQTSLDDMARGRQETVRRNKRLVDPSSPRVGAELSVFRPQTTKRSVLRGPEIPRLHPEIAVAGRTAGDDTEAEARRASLVRATRAVE